MTRSELSLLLFFETCVVDHSGLVDSRRMNEDDRRIAERWNDEKFILFGRVVSTDIMSHRANWYYANWCELSEEAFAAAHAERKARARRMSAKRTWRKTSEK